MPPLPPPIPMAERLTARGSISSAQLACQPAQLSGTHRPRLAKLPARHLVKQLQYSLAATVASRKPGEGMLLVASLFLLGGFFTVAGSLLLGLGLGFGAVTWLLVVLGDVLIAFLSLFAAFETATSYDNDGDSHFNPLSILGVLALAGGIAAGIASGGLAGVGLGVLGLGIGTLLSAFGFIVGLHE